MSVYLCRTHLLAFSIAISPLSLISSLAIFAFIASTFLSIIFLPISIFELAMAASSSIAAHYSYQVFINHRGPDVKKTFASHLYNRLSKHGLRVFLDGPELQPGDSLTSQIEGAVGTASVHVAVFSSHYAESRWCLDELLLMLKSGKTIIPVFYDVKPAELRWAGGKYAEALKKLATKEICDPQGRRRKRYDSDTIEEWRKALSRVADISGFELEKCNGDEGELVENVVRCVLKKVEKTQFHVAKYPTGLDEKVEEFEKVLLKQQQSETPPILGIVGLGGLGKTTLAKELYNRKRSDYSSCCFLFDVRDNARKNNLISLEKKILKELTGSDLQKDSIDENKTLLNKHLPSSQIFLVLDDVDHVDQVDALLPDQTAIRSDSLILITSRDKNILTSSGVENSSIYKLSRLNEQHSIELFCSHAFKKPYPLSQFESFVNKFLDACQGLPLSLKVFGALLCGQNDISYWEDQLDKLPRILPTDIKKILQISIEALDAEEREIFLDIACFFIGENRDMAIKIWDGSHWKGFQNLEDRCLVEVDSENVIHMHDHLRDLGRDIAKAPGLVCETENIDDLLQPSPVITEVRGIKMLWHTNGLSEMAWHRGILQVSGSGDGLLERILTRAHSPNLLWLRWYNCNYSSLPSWIPVHNLRVLELHGNTSTSLWEGEWQAPLQLRHLQIGCVLLKIPDSIGKLKYLERISLSGREIHEISRLPEEFCDLESLKTLVLSKCGKMKSLPDSFGNLRNLQRIDLSFCNSLERLPEAFRNLVKLKYLKLSGCSKLTMSSEILGNISTLEHIDLDGCAEIEVLPLQMAHQISLEELYLGGTNLKELPNAVVELSDLEVLVVGSPLLDTLPPSLGELRNLKTLRLEFCKKLKCLPDSVGLLTQLTQLRVEGCGKLKCLPDSVGLLTQLTQLRVMGCPIRELPSLRDWRNLKTLELWDCKELKCLPDSVGLLTQLTQLSVWECPISELPFLRDLRNLKTLELWYCKELKCLPASVGLLTQLTELRVWGCPISELPSLRDLRNLKTLELEDCDELKCLPDSVGLLTQLTQLRVRGCPISELPSLRDLRNLKTLRLELCEKLKCLPASVGLLTQLTELRVWQCPISELPSLPDLKNLKSLALSDCKELKCLPASVGLLTQLTELRVLGCPISELPSLRDLRNLKTLELFHCKELKCLPDSVGLLTQLTELRVWGCPISELPSLRDLKNLKSLALSDCKEGKCLLASVGLLTELRVSRCPISELPFLRDLRNLKTLELSDCNELKCLPDSVGLLTQLTELTVCRCPISELPSLRDGDLRNLKTLSLRDGCELEEIRGLEHLRSLEMLWLDGCVKLKKVRGLAQCTNLRWLSVEGCSELEDLEGVEHCTSLRMSQAKGCPKLQLHQRLEGRLELD